MQHTYYLMKHNTSILTALGCVIALAATAQDQPKVKPQRPLLQAAPAGGALLARPAIPRGVQLDLTEEQQAKIAELRKAHIAATRELYQNKGLDAQDRRDQIRDLSDNLQESMKAIYTPEQKAKLAKAQEEQAKRREQIQKLRIVLSDEQKAKLKELNAKRQQGYKEARELPQDERRATYQKLQQQFQKDYEKLLTDEQKEKQKKLRELLGNRPNIRIRPLPGNGQLRRVQPLRIQPAPGKGQLRQVKPLRIQPRKKD